MLNTRDIDLMEDGWYRTYPHALKNDRHFAFSTMTKGDGYVYLRLRDFDLYNQWPAWYFDKNRKQ